MTERRATDSNKFLMLKHILLGNIKVCRKKKHTADELLHYLETSGDFPDHELADNIERARREMRDEK